MINPELVDQSAIDMTAHLANDLDWSKHAPIAAALVRSPHSQIGLLAVGDANWTLPRSNVLPPLDCIEQGFLANVTAGLIGDLAAKYAIDQRKIGSILGITPHYNGISRLIKGEVHPLSRRQFVILPYEISLGSEETSNAAGFTWHGPHMASLRLSHNDEVFTAAAKQLILRRAKGVFGLRHVS